MLKNLARASVFRWIVRLVGAGTARRSERSDQ